MTGTIARMQQMADLLDRSNLGYDQGQRWTFLDAGARAVVPGGECDCSSSCGAIAWLAGYGVTLTGTFYTGNFAPRLALAGFAVLGFSSLAQVRPGDFLVTPGAHVIFVRDAARWWSAEVDERGKSSGGKGGDQTGRETRYRAPYLRPGGWTYIVRPPAEVEPATPLASTQHTTKLAVDGDFGPQTIRALQRLTGATPDGVFGPASKRALQRWLGVGVDGIVGPKTVRALQARVGAKVDGQWGRGTTRALQVYLNGRSTAV